MKSLYTCSAYKMLLFWIYISLFATTKAARHYCERECLPGAAPMTCIYHFKLEGYQTLSKACYRCAYGELNDCWRPDCIAADGVVRTIVTVNRQMPGPGIHVCLGDRIVVDVENSLSSETGSLHWHGHHQRGSPHMDGVPHVTQCPIQPGTTFRYTFLADNAGTHFWHSHSGVQRADGVAGSLIIREGSADPHNANYDTDLPAHEILITDWLHSPANTMFVFHHHGNGDNKPRSLLINGRGRFGNGTFMSNVSTPLVALTNFTLTPGFRHRFRLINAGFLNCPMELSIDNHTLLVIASDGEELQPIEVDSLVSYAGERFDFVVHANQEIGSYWMRVRGLMDCDERFNSVHQVALVVYEGAPEIVEPDAALGYTLAARGGKQLNPLNIGANDEDPNTITMAELSSLKPGDLDVLKIKPNHTFYFGYDFYMKDNPVFHRPQLYGFNEVVQKREKLLTPQLNHISLQLPGTPILLQDEASLSSVMCNQSSLAKSGRNCSKEFCRCIHRIRVDMNDVVDLVLIDEGNAFDANHPFHLHGYAFHVMDVQKFGRNVSVGAVRQYLEQEQYYASQTSLHAPLKDTISVPDGGFVRIRFRATNPGIWLFHCHIGFHIEIGMGFILQVGDWNNFVKTPDKFPTCGDWLPNLKHEDSSKDEVYEISQLQPGKANEFVLYQILQNISEQLIKSPPSPRPIVLLQHHVPSDWWVKKLEHSASTEITFNTILLVINILVSFYIISIY